MPRRWVVNASPLILLGKIRRISLLGDLADEIWLPAKVAAEVRVQPDGETSVKSALDLLGCRMQPDVEISDEVANWDLGPGESQVLSLTGRIPESRAVVDDLAARRCAHSLSLPIIGTLGVVFRATRLGLLPAARPVIDELRKKGLYASETLINEVLARLGE